MMPHKRNQIFNSEGYIDKTAFEAMKHVAQEDWKVAELIRVLECILEEAGFQHIGRIQLRNRKTGREYR